MAEMERYQIRRSGKGPLKFEGELVAESETLMNNASSYESIMQVLTPTPLIQREGMSKRHQLCGQSSLVSGAPVGAKRTRTPFVKPHKPDSGKLPDGGYIFRQLTAS